MFSLREIFSRDRLKIKYIFHHEGLFLFSALAISLFTTFGYYNQTKEYPFGSIFRILLGTADYPFQTRLFVYKFAYFLANLFNANLYYVLFALRLLTIILTLYVLRSILKELKIKNRFLPFLFPFATLFSFVDDYLYPTDFLEILSFSLMILLILKNKPLLFTIVFCFSFLNRESAIFILPFFIFYYIAQKKIKEVLIFGILLIIAVLAIRFFLLSPETYPLSKTVYQWKFSNNISSLKKFRLLWRDPSSEVVKYFFFKLITFSGFLYLLVIFYWKNIPGALKYFLAIVGPINFLSAFFVGNLNETRVYYPLIPGLILASAAILNKQNTFIRLINIFIIVIVIGFIAKDGIFLKKESEFLIKSKAFNLQEFKQWKKDTYTFQKKDIQFKKDRMIMSPPRISKTLFFLDSTIFVECPEKRPIECTIWLTKKIKYKTRFKKSNNYYYASTRHLRYEMNKPSVQSLDIRRIEIKFEGEAAAKNHCQIKWSGYSIEKKT